MTFFKLYGGGESMNGGAGSMNGGTGRIFPNLLHIRLRLIEFVLLLHAPPFVNLHPHNWVK